MPGRDTRSRIVEWCCISVGGVGVVMVLTDIVASAKMVSDDPLRRLRSVDTRQNAEKDRTLAESGVLRISDQPPSTELVS